MCIKNSSDISDKMIALELTKLCATQINTALENDIEYNPVDVFNNIKTEYEDYLKLVSGGKQPE